MDGWNTSFLLGWPIFRDYVSLREGIFCIYTYILYTVYTEYIKCILVLSPPTLQSTVKVHGEPFIRKEHKGTQSPNFSEWGPGSKYIRTMQHVSTWNTKYIIIYCNLYVYIYLHIIPFLATMAGFSES